MIVYGLKSLSRVLGGCSDDKIRTLIKKGHAPISWIGAGVGRRYFADDEALTKWAKGCGRRDIPGPTEGTPDKS